MLVAAHGAGVSRFVYAGSSVHTAITQDFRRSSRIGQPSRRTD